MAINDDDCVKRVIKAYLYFRGEASTEMLLNHIREVGYGIKKEYTPRALSSKMRIWSTNSKSGGWFRVVSFERDRKKWWRLE